MSRSVMLVICLMLFSTGAFASKARMLALGQSSAGSFIVEDTRNAFLNPATINEVKDYVIIEWGAAGSSDKKDENNTPKAEGGFFRAFGNFAYGVYMGDESDSSFNNRNNVDSGVAGSDFLEEDNKINLFFAGDAGVKWGMSLTYSSAEDEQSTSKRTQSGMGIKLGAVAGDLDGYIHYTLKNESEGATLLNDMYEDDGSMKLGLGYRLGEWKLFADYDVNSYKGSFNNSNFAKGKTQIINAGLGYVQKMSDKANFISSLSYSNTDTNVTNTSAVTTKVSTMIIPLVVGVEAEAASWLTLRGSISQNIRSNTKNTDKKSQTIADSANVAVGATFNFDNLKIDGVVGTDSSSTNPAPGTEETTGAASTNESGVLHTDSLMSRVSLSYYF